MDPTIVTIIATIAGAVASALSAAATGSLRRREEESSTAPSLEERVRTLGDALADSARAIDEIEKETRARQQLVAALEADAKRYEQIRELHRDEVEAVAQLVRSEVRTEHNRASKRQFWLSFLQNLLFFAAGVGGTLLLS